MDLSTFVPFPGSDIYNDPAQYGIEIKKTNLINELFRNTKNNANKLTEDKSPQPQKTQHNFSRNVNLNKLVA